MENGGQGEIDVLAVFDVLNSRKFPILALGLLGAALALAYLQFGPKRYKSENIFVVTASNQETPLEQWSMLAEQFGFKMDRTKDPLLGMLDRVLASEKFYAGLIGLSVNPAYPEDSSVVRLLKLDRIPKDKLAKEFAAKASRIIKYVVNKDNSYSIVVKTRSASLSRFLANQAADHLNRFFLERAKTELSRKISFLDGELKQNRRELDSLSGRLRVFLERNREVSTPLLAFTQKSLNQDLMVANEKYMLTVKAYQSLKISASQPEYFFESIVPAEEAGPMGWMHKAKLAAAAGIGSLVLAAGWFLFANWLLRISWNRKGVR